MTKKGTHSVSIILQNMIVHVFASRELNFDINIVTNQFLHDVNLQFYCCFNFSLPFISPESQCNFLTSP